MADALPQHATASAAPAALEAIGLRKALGGKAVLRGADFRLAAGAIVALRGANGSGKTTLLRCLAGLLRPDAGEIREFGRRVAPGQSARRAIGMLGHETALYPHLTLRENLLFAGRMGSVAVPRDRADQWLQRIGLQPHADRLPGQLSRGMRQRAALARALIHAPRIVLLDEPFSGLDPQGAVWLASLLCELSGDGTAVCLVIHDERMAERLAPTILELRDGRLHALRSSHPLARAA